MYKLAIFLTVTFISILILKPKETKDIRLYSILIPIVLLIIIALIVTAINGAYFAGQAIIMSVLPSIFSGVLLFYSLKKKFKTEKLKFPIILFIITLIAWGLVLYNLYLQAQISKSLSGLDLNNITAKQTGRIEGNNIKEDNFTLVNYKEVSFVLPENWNYKPQEISTDSAFQISCWEKGGSNLFVLQWFETEMNLKEYLETCKKSLNEEVSHKNAIFEKTNEGDFQNIKTLCSKFSGELLGYKYSGEIITFNNNGKTFLIMHQGDDEFYSSKTDIKILSGLKIGFLTESVIQQKKSDIPKDWTVYEIENIGKIAIPQTMELRDDNSFISLATEIVRDNIEVHNKIKMTKSQLIFQPKGGNELDKDAFSKYSRILINYTKGNNGDFYKWNERFDFSPSDEKELNEYFKKEAVAPMEAFGIKLIKWYPLEFSSVNGLSYIKTSFTRQMRDNPVVRVDKYNFYNFDESIEITLSYRLSENDKWASDFNKCINYFDFSNKK